MSDFESKPADEPVRQASLGEKVGILAIVILPLLATVYAVVLLWNRLVNWTDVTLFFVMWALTTTGISIGFHRGLTHRSFEAVAPVKFLFLVLGTMAVQGPAIEWAATHVKHHAKADREGDPHSPLEGFWHAHMGWLFRNRVASEGVYAKPFKEDPVVVFVDRTWLVWVALGFLLPAVAGYAFGGWHGFWTGMLWGGLVRMFVMHHVTWSVNSICHTFGTRPFSSRDMSTNNFIVALFSNGEGWHNNHHAFPKSAYHGLRWWEIDTSAYLIRVMKWFRLVRNVWRPSKAEMEARLRRPRRRASRGGST